MIRYCLAPDVDKSVQEIIAKLGLKHLENDVLCLRSQGSRAKKAFARVYKLSASNRTTIGVRSHYALEVISENFDTLTKAAKTKTLVHELLHIGKKPRDGFRSHKYVNTRRVEQLYHQLR